MSRSDRLCKNIEKDFACVQFGWWCPAEQTGCVCPKGWESDSYDFYDTLCVAPKYLTGNQCVDCPPGHTCDGPTRTPVDAKCQWWCWKEGNSWDERCAWDSLDCAACKECESVWQDGNNNTKKTGSVALIVAVCVAAAALLLAVAFVVRKRSIKKLQHRSESMPSVVADEAGA